MKRIDSANKAENLFGPGKHGFQGGNPAANLPATFLTPDWANHVQEEIANVIEAAGITLDGSQRNQMLLAIQEMISVDVGQVAAFSTNTAPSGWFVANGAAVSRTTYAVLFDKIGTAFGAGDGVTTFNLPDLREDFIRGASATRAVATREADAFQGHEHGTNDSANAGGGGYPGAGSSSMWRVSEAITQKTGFSLPRVADETRPRNVALLFCIKY